MNEQCSELMTLSIRFFHGFEFVLVKKVSKFQLNIHLLLKVICFIPHYELNNFIQQFLFTSVYAGLSP